MTKRLSLTGFRDIRPQTSFSLRHRLNRHCACCDITWPVPLWKIWVHILISHPHTAYSLWHFYWAPVKNKGCLLLRPPMLKSKSGENFVPTKIGQILAVLRVWGSGGVKLWFLLQKARPYANPRRSFKPFCVKIGRGVWPPCRFGGKIKSQRLT